MLVLVDVHYLHRGRPHTQLLELTPIQQPMHRQTMKVNDIVRGTDAITAISVNARRRV